MLFVGFIITVIMTLSAPVFGQNDPLIVNPTGEVGIGTSSPSSELEVSSSSSNTDLRVSAACGFCSTRLSFISDKGFASEWRPGFIRSGDNIPNGFGGRLDFMTNGSGVGNRFGEKHAMSIFNGRVGVNETNPQSTLHVDGFTKLGDDAPKIKMKKLTGVTSTSNGGTSDPIPHGIADAFKILSVTAVIQYTTSKGHVTNNYTANPGLEVGIFFDEDNIELINKAGNSAFILGKPVRILIVYEE